MGNAAAVFSRAAFWAALYILAATIGRLTRPDESPVALVWPAAGVAVLWVLYQASHRRAVTLALLMVLSAGVNFVTGASLWIALVLGAANVVHAGVAAVVLEHRALERRTSVTGGSGVCLANTGDLLRLGAASAAGAVASLPFGLLVWSLAGGASMPVAAGSWLLRYGVITVIVVAVALSWEASAWQRLIPDRTARLELFVMAVATGVVYGGLFFTPPGESLAFLVLPITVWVAVRAGTFLAALHGLLTGAVAVTSALLEIGPFGSITDPLEQSIVIQSFIAVVGLVGLALSVAVADRRRALVQASDARQTLQRTIDSAPIGHAVIALDHGSEGEILYANPALERWLSGENSVVGASWLDLVDDGERDRARSILVDLDRRGSWHGEFRHATPGGLRWSEVVVAPLPPAQGPGNGVSRQASLQLLDVTARREFADRLHHQAMHDDLTGLPNRVMLRERLELALAMAGRSHRAVALLFIDLDHFKHINDSFGHAAGDAVIAAIGRRLVQGVRPGDTVARIGGDEFVVCCPEITEHHQAAEIAARLLRSIEEPIDVAGRRTTIGASVGIATADWHADAGDLLRESDSAMYQAKSRGRGRVEFFDQSLFEQSQRRLHIAAEIRHALEHDQFVLHYQPIVSLETGDVAAVEALVRWEHPDRGLLLPGEWMDVAEDSGLMPQLDSWVLDRAVTRAAELPPDSRIQVHVNVSAAQLREGGIADSVERVLHDNEFDPTRLVLELTESQLLTVSAELLDDLHHLRDVGVVLAVDDFGAHYSSLSHLTTLPVEEIKIDKSFVLAMDDDPRARAVVHGVLGMAHAIGLAVVAEGVENERAAAELRDWDCEFGQGFLWARPQPWSSVRTALGHAT
jgi:diguanylate cyclase (GGDEF)-like protein